jgi:hypothetical protein
MREEVEYAIWIILVSLLLLPCAYGVPYSFGGLIKDSSNTVFDAGECPPGYTKHLVHTADKQ